MLVMLTTGQWRVHKCHLCFAHFHGPNAVAWLVAHWGASHILG